MRTNLDPDDEMFIPELTEADWARAIIGRGARKPGEKHEIRIDGAVGYSLRLIPSNKVLARFSSTLEAWPVIIATVEGGRSPRTLSLDWIAADGRTESISAGPRLERWARSNNGESHPYADHAMIPPRRVAETSEASLSSAPDLRPRAASATVDAGRLHVSLADGRELIVPLSWFRWLDAASDEQRADLEVIEFGLGIWWESLDEGVSVPWLLGLPHH